MVDDDQTERGIRYLLIDDSKDFSAPDSEIRT